MARITEKNAMFRTKEKMCADIAEVLNSKTLSHGTKRSVVDHVLWVWSEFHGKYEGCPYWSESAIESGEEDVDLIHDHAIPRKLIREEIFKHDENANTQTIRDILEKNCIGVVITKDEDLILNGRKLRSAMPLGKTINDTWSRYTDSNIRIFHSGKCVN